MRTLRRRLPLCVLPAGVLPAVLLPAVLLPAVLLLAFADRADAKEGVGLPALVRAAAAAPSTAARGEAVAAIASLGAPAVEPLFKLMDAGPAAERAVAAEALGAIGGEEVALRVKGRFGKLQGRPTTENAAERRLLLVAFARARGSASVELVCDALHDEALRETAKAELVRMGPGAARELVITATEQPEVVQEAAIEILATMPEAAAPLVVPLFQRPTDASSRFAGMLLAELKDPRIVPQLVALVRDRTAHDESDVLRALAVYDVPEARRAIADALSSPFPYLRFAAVEVVRGWTDDAGVALVRDRLRAMARADDAEDVRAGAARTLLAHWDTGAADTLLETLWDGDALPLARVAAAEALGFLGPAEASLDVVRVLEAAPAAPGLVGALRAALRRLTYRPEGSDPAAFRIPPPAREALGDPIDLEPLPGGAASGPDAALSAWTNGEDGPVVFVLAGLPDFGPRTVAAWLGELADDYRIVAVALPDPRGAAAASLGWEQAFDHGLAALRADLDVESATFVGHGFGALLALRYAARHPDRVTRLVLVGMPQPRRSAWDAWMAAALGRLTRAQFADLELLRTGWQGEPPLAAARGGWRVLAPTLFHEPANAVLVRDAAGPADLGRARLDAIGPFDQQPDFDALAIPTLLVVGQDDPLPDDQRAAYRRRHEETGGRQRFVEIPGAGHFPHLEQPAAFRAELRAWLPAVD